jgi:group I intron endonuclease
MRQGTIYLITNLINDNKYVGQTVMQLNKRWLAHIQESKTNTERPLYRAINKYGIENFKVKILEECNEDILSEKEIYWIDKLETYKKGYNATTGGETNKNIREDIKEKISQSMSEIERSDEWVNNVSKSLKAKFDRGEKWGFMLHQNEGGNHNKRKIKGTNVKTGEVIVFDSSIEAAIQIGDKRYSGNICRAIREGFNAYGYKWEKLDHRPLKREVKGYDKKTGKLVYQFESVNKAEIAIRGKRGTGIIKSLKNPGKNSWVGCYWYYD